MFKDINSVFSKYNLRMPIYILNTQNYKINGSNLQRDYKYYINNSDEVFITLGDIKYNTNMINREYLKDKSYHSIYKFIDIKLNIYTIYNYKNELLLQIN